jgi:hypothetical protein
MLLLNAIYGDSEDVFSFYYITIVQLSVKNVRLQK